jgi:hypothetical protein
MSAAEVEAQNIFAAFEKELAGSKH